MQATSNFQIRIKAISDDHYQHLARRSVSIVEQLPMFTSLRIKALNSKDLTSLNLAEYYAWMRYAFGEPSRYYDNWKGGFAFVFQVEVIRNNHTYPHILRIVNWRSTVDFRFSRVLDTVESASSLVCRQPIEEEMSAEEMEFLDFWLYGFLQGVGRVAKHIEIPSFYKTAESNWISYGYFDGEFFEHRHDEQKSFESERIEYMTRLGNMPLEPWDIPLITDWLYAPSIRINPQST